MEKEDLEKLKEGEEYVFTVEVDGILYKDVKIVNNSLWRGSIGGNYKVISYKECN